MPEQSIWTSADFETLSWHDCHVYGVRLDEGDPPNGGEVEFDIDFIVEWLCHNDRSWEFRVAPATLTFHNVFDLRLELDYATIGAGMTPFTIAAIEREAVKEAVGNTCFRWRIPINWPSGLITFQASGFTLVLRRPPILVSRQSLLSDERRGA